MDNLRESGEVTSEGVFTLSLERSSWKLSEYRLANPAEYPVHVVACAVAGGATRLEVRYEGGVTILTFDGAPFEESDFLALSNTLAQPSMPRRLKELEVALSAAASFGLVRFAARSRAFCKELRIVKNEVSVVDLPSSELNEYTFVVNSALPREDFETCIQRCRFAPLQLTANGNAAVYTLDFGISRQTTPGVWRVEGGEPLKVRPVRRTRKVFHQSRLESHSPSLLLCLTDCKSEQESEFYLLSDGVVMENSNLMLGMPGLSGAVTTSHLRKDLSEKHFVRDAKFESFRAWVQAEVDAFLRAFCKNPPDLSKQASAVLCRRLRRRYAGVAASPEVIDFLLSRQDFEPTLEQSKLKRLVKQAKTLKTTLPIEQMSKALQAEVLTFVGKQDWSQASCWLEALSYLRELSEQENSVTELLKLCVLFLDDRLPPEVSALSLIRLATQEALPLEWRYRVFLLAYAIDSSSSEEVFDSLPVAAEWTDPIRFLQDQPVWLEFEREVTVWSMLFFLLNGDIARFHESYDLLSKERREFKKERPCWLEILGKLSRGKLRWLDEIRLTARRSLAWVGVCPEYRRSFQDSLQEVDKALGTGEKQAVFLKIMPHRLQRLPFLAYLLVRLNKKHPTLAPGVLARHLLTYSLLDCVGPNPDERILEIFKPSRVVCRKTRTE